MVEGKTCAAYASVTYKVENEKVGDLRFLRDGHLFLFSTMLFAVTLPDIKRNACNMFIEDETCTIVHESMTSKITVCSLYRTAAGAFWIIITLCFSQKYRITCLSHLILASFDL